MTRKKAAIEDVDKEFGDSPIYWYGLLSVCIENQKVAMDVIERLQMHSYNRGRGK